MNTFTTLVVLAALFSIAAASSAQVDSLCYKVNCNGLNGECNVQDDTKHFIDTCKGGYYCLVSGSNASAAGTCQQEPVLLEACSTAACNGKGYDITCSQSTCLYPGALGPGESCSNVKTSNYANGNPCITLTQKGSNSSVTCTGSCGSLAGSTCDPTTPCGLGSFCNYSTGNCQGRVGNGGFCSSTSQCVWSAVCSTLHGTSSLGAQCVTVFSAQDGTHCDSGLECQSGFCSLLSNTCAKPNDGQSCTISGTSLQGSCPSLEQECVCTGGAGSTSGKCISSAITGSEISEAKSYFNCMSSNCKYDSVGAVLGVSHSDIVTYFTPDTCAAVHCSVSKTIYNQLYADDCGAASALSMFVALMMALAAFALML